MSAEVLRKAVALMRERAKAVRPDDLEGDAYFTALDHYDLSAHTLNCGWRQGEGLSGCCECSVPAVVLLVAEWLETTERDTGSSSLAYHAALAVARAYLDEQP